MDFNKPITKLLLEKTYFHFDFLEEFYLWRRDVVVIATTQYHSTKPKLRFCAGSNPSRRVSEICHGENF